MQIRQFWAIFILPLVLLVNAVQAAELSVKTGKKRNTTRHYNPNSKHKIMAKMVSKSIRDQSIDELSYNLELYIQAGNLEMAVKYLEALIPKLLDFAHVRSNRLRLADLYFDLERYEKAGSHYSEYYDAYPGHETAEYVLWRALLAKYRQIGACDQDNGVTRDVLELTKKYLQNKAYQKFRTQVVELSQSCEKQLLEAEIVVFEHYFKQNQLDSAQRRLDYIQDKILPKFSGEQPNLAVLYDLMTQARQGKSPIKLLHGRRILDLIFKKTQPTSAPKVEEPKLVQGAKSKPYAKRF